MPIKAESEDRSLADYDGVEVVVNGPDDKPLDESDVSVTVTRPGGEKEDVVSNLGITVFFDDGDHGFDVPGSAEKDGAFTFTANDDYTVLTDAHGTKHETTDAID